jgi:hypothetical protein
LVANGPWSRPAPGQARPHRTPWATTPGIETVYDVLRGHADRFDVGGFEVRVASVEDLIAMKTAAGQAKDLGDIEELEAILRLRSED